METTNVSNIPLQSFTGFAFPGSNEAHGIPAVTMNDGMLRAIHAGSVEFYQGKVRDSFIFPGKILMITSDRVSAFDRILDTIPLKGEILNRISLFWFDQTKDIIQNHIIESPGSRTLLVQAAEVLPVEVVVRGYLTGSAWRDYRAGKAISGITPESGMKENQAFPTAIITPSTKAEVGTHDEPVSREEIISRGIVSEDLWSEIEATALALFARGQEIASRQGLILVDTKYEFGLVDGKLTLIDEIHTPDSSRYWYSDSYAENFENGMDQKKLDKEYLRRWLMDEGFMGEGVPPEIPLEVKSELASKYIQAFELITGQKFIPLFDDIEAEYKIIRSYFRG